jgi:hypothetical protein
MATKQSEEALVQVATCVPASLLTAVKVWCVEHGVSVMDFVADAVRDKLRRTRVRRV